MILAILIPTKHRHAELARSLRSVRTAAGRVGAAILVCDQSPVAFAAPAGVQVMHRPDLSGLPAARNALLAATDAEVVLFLDDDTDLAAETCAILMRLAAAEPDGAAWGPVVEVRTARWRRLHRLLNLGSMRDVRRLTARRVDRGTDALFGCCFAVRRQAALAIGGFDARLPGYALGEDRDFCRRLASAGYRLRFAADLRAHHRCAGSAIAPLARLRRTAPYLRWWASRHGRGNPATPLHLALALAASALAAFKPNARNA